MQNKPKKTEMGNSERTLIIFDTNNLQNTLDGESDYSTFDPKGDIKKLRDFISKNNLQDNIIIGLSEIVLKEYCNHRKTDFIKKLDQFKQLHSKMKNLSCINFDNITFPPDNFDYGNYIYDKIREIVSNENSIFILIPIEEEKCGEIFKKILYKSINHIKPFDERGDKGFKDAIIFESLINFQIKNNYAKVILFSKDLGFSEELRWEFSRLTGKFLDIESNYELLEQNLMGVYHLIVKYPELLNHLKTDYFKGQLMDYMSDFEGLGINNFEIINCCSGIEDCKKEDLEKFRQEEYLEEVMDNFKIVSLEFENDGKEYIAEVLFDLSVNEIIGGGYEGKQEVQVI